MKAKDLIKGQYYNNNMIVIYDGSNVDKTYFTFRVHDSPLGYETIEANIKEYTEYNVFNTPLWKVLND